MGLVSGPVVAATLQAIEAKWIDESFPDDARLRDIAVQAVRDARSASI